VVDDAARQAREMLEEPLVLRVEDRSLTLEAGDLARLVEVRPTADEDGLELAVTEDSVEAHLAEEASATFDLEPQSARYTIGRTPPTEFDEQADATFRPVEASVGLEPGVDGRRFDTSMAATQLTELVRDGAREAQLRVEVVEPELPTDRAEEQRPTHLIGTFTTYYQAGQTRNAEHPAARRRHRRRDRAARRAVLDQRDLRGAQLRQGLRARGHHRAGRARRHLRRRDLAVRDHDLQRGVLRRRAARPVEGPLLVHLPLSHGP
jgi:hypothetical protein